METASFTGKILEGGRRREAYHDRTHYYRDITYTHTFGGDYRWTIDYTP